MSVIIVLIVIFLLIYCTTSWILPKLLAWLFEYKFKVIIRIGRIGIPYLKLCDVHIAKKGFTIHIDEISIKSSFFNSDLTKLVTLVAKDVRINKDVLGKTNLYNDPNRQVLDFRNKKIPHFITTFAQFMAIHIYNISTMFLHSETPGWLIHATANELHVDGSIVQNARTLLVNVTLSEVSAKLLKHPEKQVNEETCLGQLSFAISMEATLVAQGPLSVEKLHISTTQTAATINDSFYSLAQENKTNAEASVTTSYDEDNLYYRILPVIPKNFTYKMEDLSIRGVRENSRTEFISTLNTFAISSRFINLNSPNLQHSFPHMYYSFQMSNLHIYNSREELLLLKNWTLDAKLENDTINLYLKLNTLSLTYNHDTIHKWVQANFLRYKHKLSLNKSNIKSVVKSKNINKFESLMQKLVVSGCAEFCQVSALFNLCGHNSYIGFNHIKLILEQSLETRDMFYDAYLPKLLLSNRHWQTEVLMESLWWSFKEWTQESMISKKTHVWNTPIFLGMTLFKFGTYGSTETKIESLLDTLQLEWSDTLASYIQLAIKCFKQYDWQTEKHEQQKSRKIFNHCITINFALSHLNLFLSTHDTEYLITRLNSVTLDKNTQMSTANFKGLKITTVKSNNDTYNCVRTEDIYNYNAFVRIAQLEFNNNLSEVLMLMREIETFIADIKNNQELQTNVNKKSSMMPWNMRICGNFAFHIQISEKHSAKLGLGKIFVTTVTLLLGDCMSNEPLKILYNYKRLNFKKICNI